MFVILGISNLLQKSPLRIHRQSQYFQIMVVREEVASERKISLKPNEPEKNDNLESRKEMTEREENASEELLDSEIHLGSEKSCEFSLTEEFQDIFKCSELFRNNNFESENDYLKHFEDVYEEEYLKNVVVDSYHHSTSLAIKQWLENMEKKLDFIYLYEDDSEEEDDIESEEEIDSELEYQTDSVYDPFISLDDIPDESIEEILSLATSKRLSKIQGRCILRLTDGTEIIGSWQGGYRNGLGSVSSPILNRLGVNMLAGTYRDGYLDGIGRIHMMDGTIREGRFKRGKADGPFRGSVKVVYGVLSFIIVFTIIISFVTQIKKYLKP